MMSLRHPHLLARTKMIDSISFNLLKMSYKSLDKKNWIKFKASKTKVFKVTAKD